MRHLPELALEEVGIVTYANTSLSGSSISSLSGVVSVSREILPRLPHRSSGR